MNNSNPAFDLQIIPTKKFKTIRIEIRFAAPLARENSTPRALLAALLETSSKKYPTQQALSTKLAELYGATFGANVSRRGQQHWLNLQLSIVNEKYLQEKGILAQAVDLLKEIVFSPNITEDHFETMVFERAKQNLKDYIASLEEDKQSWATLKIQEEYFAEQAQKVPAFGALRDFVTLTPESLVRTYREMLTHDKLTVAVLGDVDPEEIELLFADFASLGDPQLKLPLFYAQDESNLIHEAQEEQPVIQSKLNLAYDTGIYYYDELYFPQIVANALFGGSAVSKLFLNVREKASLAYSISSSSDVFRGCMFVQTGIDRKNRERVLRMVNEELESLRRGEVESETLKNIKRQLRNQFLIGQDQIRTILDQNYLANIYPAAAISTAEWLKRLEAVSIKEIQKAAERWNLSAIYFLEGAGKNEENI